MALQEEFESHGNWLFRYRSYLPLVIILIGWARYLRRILHPEEFPLFFSEFESMYFAVGIGVGLLGLLVRVYTVGYSPRNTSGRNTKEGQVADTLNQTGIYSLVRHPLYVGNFLMWLGPALVTVDLWFIISFCLLYWVYYERIMYAEEQFLRRKFGNEYLVWSAKVPAFLPNFRKFTPPQISFSWKKVFKKEKNGLSALFLIFFLFDASVLFLNPAHVPSTTLTILCVGCGFLYLVLKILKTKTSLLAEVYR
uniref:methyltransferase family protein n=1 Tax=Algoriphagus sp. TaxID=1872435 RepID=UPI004047AD99